MSKSLNVAVVGASDKEDRYSYKAVMLLHENGHVVFPVHPRLKKIESFDVSTSLENIQQPIDTVSMYVNAQLSDQMTDALLMLHPKRVIFNPGAENAALAERLTAEGIKVVNACTLVMLKTGQF